MNNAKQRYQKKVVRKYVDFYPTEQNLVAYVDKQKKAGVPFATLIKCLLAMMVTAESRLGEVMNDESKKTL